jgi:hypothetical protein
MHLTSVAAFCSIVPLWRSIRKLPRNFKIGLPRRTLAGTICSVCGGPKDFDALDGETTGPGGWDVCFFVVRNATSKLLSRQGPLSRYSQTPAALVSGDVVRDEPKAWS